MELLRTNSCGQDLGLGHLDFGEKSSLDGITNILCLS
jgi:hypothetical protein